MRPCVALALSGLVLAMWAPTAIARADDDSVRPYAQFAIGGFWPFHPTKDAHLIGGASIGVGIPFGEIDDRRLGLSLEAGYSADRNGYLEARHFVAGLGFRFGNEFGVSLLSQFAFGRTQGDRSRAFREGARIDILYGIGMEVFFELRQVLEGPMQMDARGLRFQCFLDPIALARALYAVTD